VTLRELSGPRVAFGRTHGTGCALSAAVTAGLALGRPLEKAVDAAKAWLTRALETAPPIGHGGRSMDLLRRAPGPGSSTGNGP
jgi:hydroxymethylpyrimidine/phosphomethylpyrimidine kinase